MSSALLGHDLSFGRIGASDLPIFRADTRLHSLFYTSGFLAVVDRDHAVIFEAEVFSSNPDSRAAGALRDSAQRASVNWSRLTERPFEPVCLTLYLNNECNLRCCYCYSCPSPEPGIRLDKDTIQQAAALVAVNCKRRKTPLTVVFHGGGEPTLHQALTDSALDTVEQIAREQGLGIFRYVATNGVMPATKARWLAQRFDLIGLSCDGPMDIQDNQRPLWGGGSTSSAVQRTARIVKDSGKPLSIRVTLTRESFRRQAEIADYLCQMFQPREIHVEPVYEVGRAEDGTTVIESAEEFVSEFLHAERIAQAHGVRWQMSISRPEELHGPYCHLFRDVLQLVPGSGAIACFKVTDADTARRQGSLIGERNTDGTFSLNAQRISELQTLLQHEPEMCQNCFNKFHCVRTCPEYCPLESSPHQAGFRCQIGRLLMGSRLLEIANRLLGQPSTTGIRATWIPRNDREPV